MPEFILSHGDAESEHQFNTLDAFAQGYVEAMFFTNCSDPDDDDLSDATTADLAPETWVRIADDCQAFQALAADLLSQAYERGYTAEQAGRDFWFTRNGHGVGFWDRRELAEGNLGDRLSELCRHRDVSPYMGDDGKVYLQ